MNIYYGHPDMLNDKLRRTYFGEKEDTAVCRSADIYSCKFLFRPSIMLLSGTDTSILVPAQVTVDNQYIPVYPVFGI